MRLDLMRDNAKVFPSLETPDNLKYLRVWHCKYKSLAPIASCINLKELVIGSYPDISLEILGSLSNLEYLSILHMPKVTSLSPLARLIKLRSLSLATSPSWDAAGKKIIVESLEPIATLPNLKHLELFGVCPPDMRLVVLKQSRSLVSARFSKYSSAEIEHFYQETNLAREFNPLSSFS